MDTDLMAVIDAANVVVVEVTRVLRKSSPRAAGRSAAVSVVPAVAGEAAAMVSVMKVMVVSAVS